MLLCLVGLFFDWLVGWFRGFYLLIVSGVSVSVKFSVWHKICVSHTVVLSFATVPGIKAGPEHEMVTGMAMLSFIAVEKQVWVCTFLLLLFLASVLLHRKRQQHRNHAFSPKFTFLMKLYSLFMQKKDAPVVWAAVQTFRDVLWVLMWGTVVSPCLIPLCTEHFYISPWFWEYKTPGRCSAVTLSAVERQNCQLVAGTGWKPSQFLAGFS